MITVKKRYKKLTLSPVGTFSSCRNFTFFNWRLGNAPIMSSKRPAADETSKILTKNLTNITKVCSIGGPYLWWRYHPPPPERRPPSYDYGIFGLTGANFTKNQIFTISFIVIEKRRMMSKKNIRQDSADVSFLSRVRYHKSVQHL